LIRHNLKRKKSSGAVKKYLILLYTIGQLAFKAITAVEILNTIAQILIRFFKGQIHLALRVFCSYLVISMILLPVESTANGPAIVTQQ